ncbi:phage protein GemA/Gp16 family protein [Peptoanaerobacter stomatis]|uniref:phage protein GemA/Gp16 family protein n=1 Tax=Peptoanaerobacter stomatis TaxID=796937 RepID=UPI003FA0F7D7
MAYRITKRQIQNLYAIAAKLSLVESGNKNDDFHSVVYSVTGKSSVSELNGAEYYKVRNRLIQMQGAEDKNIKKKNKKESVAKVEGMTQGQCSKVWYLMYEFEKASPSHATVGERLKGIIKRQLNIDVNTENPFVWLTHKDGNKLIEILKKYVASAEYRAVKK